MKSEWRRTPSEVEMGFFLVVSLFLHSSTINEPESDSVRSKQMNRRRQFLRGGLMICHSCLAREKHTVRL